MTTHGLTAREDEIVGALLRVMKLALTERDVRIAALEEQNAELQRIQQRTVAALELKQPSTDGEPEMSDDEAERQVSAGIKAVP